MVPDMLVKGMTGVSAVLHDGGGRPRGAFGLLIPSAGLKSQSGQRLIDSLRRERDWAEREIALQKDARWLGSHDIVGSEEPVPRHRILAPAFKRDANLRTFDVARRGRLRHLFLTAQRSTSPFMVLRARDSRKPTAASGRPWRLLSGRCAP